MSGHSASRLSIRRLTFPLPWWAAVSPAVVVVIVSAVWVGKSLAWWYISLPQLSVLPQESVMITGPLACIGSAAVGAWFLDRRSPLAAAHVARSAGTMHLRVLACLAGWYGGALVLGCGAMTIVSLLRATGGSYYVVEALIALPKLLAFVASGLLVGMLLGRRLAPIGALAWSLVWVFGIPVLAQMLGVPTSAQSPYGTVLMFTIPQSHSIASRLLLTLVVVWWVAVIGVLVALVWSIARWRARARATALALSATGAAAVCAAGALLLLVPINLFGGTSPEPPVCQAVPSVGAEVCVAPEQRPTLGFISAQVEQVRERLGTWPTEQRPVVATAPARKVLEATDKATRGSTIEVPMGTNGTRSIARIVARDLAGLAACPLSAGPGDPTRSAATVWSAALADWIAGDTRDTDADSPEAVLLANTPAAAITTWYESNTQALLTCTYEGPGPG